MLGQPPSDEHMRQYLAAYFDDSLPGEAIDALVAAGDSSVDTVRQRLERSYEQVSKQRPEGFLVLTSINSEGALLVYYVL